MFSRQPDALHQLDGFLDGQPLGFAVVRDFWQAGGDQFDATTV